MRVVKTIAFTGGLTCERCLSPIDQHDFIAMLIESLAECKDTIVWCIDCADEAAADSDDMDWADGPHYGCMGCGFVVKTDEAENLGWVVDPAGIGVYCFFCAHEAAEGPGVSLPLSSSTIPQEKVDSGQRRRKLILWAAAILQMVLIGNIGLDWLTIIPLSGLGYLAGVLLKLYARELAALLSAARKWVTG